ncbi:MAG: hypothetical protein ACOWWM_12695 [Desulfobacterales bacterium]
MRRFVLLLIVLLLGLPAASIADDVLPMDPKLRRGIEVTDNEVRIKGGRSFSVGTPDHKIIRDGDDIKIFDPNNPLGITLSALAAGGYDLTTDLGESYDTEAELDALFGATLSNPMTTQYDIIYGGVDGVPTRFGAVANRVLGWDASGVLGAFQKLNVTGTDQDQVLVSGADPFAFAPLAITEQTVVGRVTGGNVAAIPMDDTPEDSSAKVATSKAVFDERTSTATLSGKTIDAANNVIKGYGYIVLTLPHSVGPAVTRNDTDGTINYGRAIFADDDSTDNWIEWVISVPPDLDTTVDLQGTFAFLLSDADTADHKYVASMGSFAASEDMTGAILNSVELPYTADASGASGDAEATTAATLTGWATALTPGDPVWRIRITRDGTDATNDASTVDSVAQHFIIRYGFTQ